MLRDDHAENIALALHYMLSNERRDLLLKHRIVYEPNMSQTETNYTVKPGIERYLTAAGYHLSASGSNIEITPLSIGWYE